MPPSEIENLVVDVFCGSNCWMEDEVVAPDTVDSAKPCDSAYPYYSAPVVFRPLFPFSAIRFDNRALLLTLLLSGEPSVLVVKSIFPHSFVSA